MLIARYLQRSEVYDGQTRHAVRNVTFYLQTDKIAYPFEDIHSAECADKVDSTKDDLSHKRVIETYSRKHGCAVVKEVIGARQLLKTLKTHPK